MMFGRLFILTLTVCLTWVGSAAAQQQESRVALVIGNGAYKSSPLKNPVNDSKDIATKLRSLGFTVIERNNLVVKQIGITLREFRSSLKPGSVALVFYAGHGVQIKGENYLPAVDAEIGGEEDVPNQSLAMRQLMDILGEAKTRLNLVFLDACRDNPYARSFRSSASGLSKENAPSGTLISFATRPGSVASDGDGRNGLYTGALLAAMNEPNRPIEQVLKSVISTVKAGSKNQQEPWMEGSIEGEFCFGECKQYSISQSPPTEKGEAQREDAFWAEAKMLGNREAFEAYLIAYPVGRYSNLAKAAISRLGKLAQVPVSPVTSMPTSQQTSPQSTNAPLMPPGTAFRDCDECPEMVIIPGGEFQMGSRDEPFGPRALQNEQPQHSVSVKLFSMGKYEVTQEQWYSLMGNNPSDFRGKTLPVNNVTWEDAKEYVRRLSDKTGKTYRLPTEAEWEYSARAGSKTKYFFGDDELQVTRHAWVAGNSLTTTHPVGAKLPNAFDLYDVLGNVGEWVEDCWTNSYERAPSDGSALVLRGCFSAVIRGGNFTSPPGQVRSAFRMSVPIRARARTIGLRVARDL